MSNRQLLVTGRYVVTNDHLIGSIENGALICSGEHIIEVGDFSTLKSNYPDALIMGGENYVVLPGLINAHGHGRGLSFIQKGYPDSPLELWGERKMGVDPYYDAIYSAIKLIKSGVTTTLVQRSSRNRQRLKAFVDSGMRVSFALDITDRSEFVYDVNDDFLNGLPEGIRGEALRVASRPIKYYEYLKLIEEFRKIYQGNSRVQIQLGPISLQWCSEELLRNMKNDASAMGMRIHMHLLETVYQREYAKKKFGETAVSYLERIGFLSENMTFAHCVWVTREDINILYSHNCNIVHNPSSNFSTWAGVMPLLPTMNAGIPIALGIDDAGLNDDDDFFTEMRLCLKYTAMA